MNVAAKVQLVEQIQAVAGLAPALRVLELPRSTWYYRVQHPRPYEERHAVLRGPLERIARAPPDYGYRRTTTELREQLDRRINQKVVRRLHRLWDLALLRRVQPPPPSGVRRVLMEAGSRINLVRPGLQVDPLRRFYTDFTERVYGGGKAWLMTLVDHVTKVAPGWALGHSTDTALALRAWRRARRWLQRRGFPVAGIIVPHDRDPVYTAYGWLEELLVRDQVKVSFALNGCRDNPEMESFHSRFKGENRSLLLDAQTFADLTHVVNQRLRDYNARRRHSALGNQAPLAYLASLFSQS